MILDTNYLVALGKNDECAFRKGVELVESGETQWVPVPVIQELEYGVACTGSEAEKRRVRNVWNLYPPVEINREIARRAGQLAADADLGNGGTVGAAGIDSIDPMVAAVADRFDDAVLTDNVSDFEALGVPVESF
ncbi:PIN domain-containing protein [Natronomonas sp.]|uniref:PIN domain-containing protein n=1 Tax=Natronomonas sp. TaxID=2184060 RepID=UPI002FC333B0